MKIPGNISQRKRESRQSLIVPLVINSPTRNGFLDFPFWKTKCRLPDSRMAVSSQNVNVGSVLGCMYWSRHRSETRQDNMSAATERSKISNKHNIGNLTSKVLLYTIRSTSSEVIEMRPFILRLHDAFSFVCCFRKYLLAFGTPNCQSDTND